LGKPAADQDRGAVGFGYTAHVLDHEKLVRGFPVPARHVYVLAQSAFERAQLEFQASSKNEQEVNIPMPAVEVNGIAGSKVGKLPRWAILQLLPCDFQMDKLLGPPGIRAEDYAVYARLAREVVPNRSQEGLDYAVILMVFHGTMGYATLGGGTATEAWVQVW